MEQLTPAFIFQQQNATSNPQRCAALHPIKHDCAGVTAGTWAAHLKECMIELHNTSRNPSETNPYPQEPCQHATAKQKYQQSTTVILRLDFTYYKMMNAPNSTTVSNFQF